MSQDPEGMRERGSSPVRIEVMVASRLRVWEPMTGAEGTSSLVFSSRPDNSVICQAPEEVTACRTGARAFLL